MRSTESQRMATSAELLRSSNFCLKSTVQELRLEIAYYQGEAKRLEWEKNVLKQDLGKMSALFKGWLDLLQCSNTRSIVDETEYFKNLVKNPTKNISEILQMNDLKLLVTTCQAPFFIEHTNKAWSLECGWDSHEVLGLSCAFLQGEATHLKTAATFTKNIKEFGYANMRINNYRKNGSLFNVSVTSFPIYDSLAVNGVSSDVPILTHFATILSDIRDLTSEDMETEVSDSVTQVIEGYIMPRATHEAAPTAVPTPISVFSSSTAATSFPFSSSSPSHSSSSMNTSAFPSIHPTTSSSPHFIDAPPSSSSAFSSSTGRFYDRRARSMRFEAECQMTSEDFLETVATIRLSDLLRLMLSCKDAMVLTDRRGRIVHCNGAWVELTGHTLTDAEGLDCDILHGSMTDSSEIRRCNGLRRAFQASVSTVVNYRKDGLMFLNSVTTSPIRGIYMSEDVSHYCALLIPQPPQYALNDTFNLNLGYACSSSSGSCSGYGSKRDRSCKSKSLSDSEDDDNNNNTDDYSSDLGATMEMKKVRNNIFLDRQAICSDSEIECHPRNRDRDRGQYYTHENTTQLNNNDNKSSSNSSNDTLNILSDNNTSSSEHRMSSSSQSTTSSSSGSSLRSSLSSRSFQREVHNFSEKPCAHLNVLHTAKNSSKHLRIDSKIVSSNDNSSGSNSVNDQSSSSGTDTNVDSPITDGNDSP